MSAQPELRVFFTSTPQTVWDFEDPELLRDALVDCAEGAEPKIEFEHFEILDPASTKKKRGKQLVATDGERSTKWRYKNGVWDFHTFRERQIDFSTLSVFWQAGCTIRVGSETEDITFKSTQSFAQFERAILTSRYAENVISPVIQVKIGGSSPPPLLTEELFWQRITTSESLEILVRSQRASYSNLKACFVLPKFDFVPPIDTNMRSEDGPAEISALFKDFTRTPDAAFTSKVRDFAKIMLRTNRSNPYGLFRGYEYLGRVRSSFPQSYGIDWNETQRRTICDPLMYMFAGILSRRVYEEVDVWPSNHIPKEATGHGPLDYYLPGPAAIVGHKTARKRNYDETNDNIEEERGEGGGEGDTTGSEAEGYLFNGDFMSEKKTSNTVESALAQVLAQALDTMRSGSLKALPRDDTTASTRRFCVLSTGQRYYFFRIDWEAHRETKPIVTFLGLYRFRYFPSRNKTNLISSDEESFHRTSDLGVDEVFSMEDYLNVLAAFVVCVLDGKTDADLDKLLAVASAEFQALTSTEGTLLMSLYERLLDTE